MGAAVVSEPDRAGTNVLVETKEPDRQPRSMFVNTALRPDSDGPGCGTFPWARIGDGERTNRRTFVLLTANFFPLLFVNNCSAICKSK